MRVIHTYRKLSKPRKQRQRSWKMLLKADLLHATVINVKEKEAHQRERERRRGIIWSDLSTQTLRQGIELLIYNSRRLSGHTAGWSNRSLFCDNRNCIRMTVYSFWTTIMMLWWRDRKHWWLVTRKQIQVTSPDGDSGHLNTNLMDLQHDISTMFGSTSEY